MAKHPPSTPNQSESAWQIPGNPFMELGCQPSLKIRTHGGTNSQVLRLKIKNAG